MPEGKWQRPAKAPFATLGLQIDQRTAELVCKIVSTFSTRVNVDFPAHAKAIITQCLQGSGCLWKGNFQRWLLPDGRWIVITFLSVRLHDNKDDLIAWWAPSRVAAEFALQASERCDNARVRHLSRQFLGYRESLEELGNRSISRKNLNWEVSLQALFALERSSPALMRRMYDRQVTEQEFAWLQEQYRLLQESLFADEENMVRPRLEDSLSVQCLPEALLRYFPRRVQWREKSIGKLPCSFLISMNTEEWEAAVRIEALPENELRPGVLEGYLSLEDGATPAEARLGKLEWAATSWSWFAALRAWTLLCRGYGLQQFSVWEVDTALYSALRGAMSRGLFDVERVESGWVQCRLPP